MSKPNRCSDPLKKAVRSSRTTHWTIRITPDEEDVQRMLARALAEYGRNKKFWIMECLRSGLSKYAGKKDGAPTLLRPTSFKP